MPELSDLPVETSSVDRHWAMTPLPTRTPEERRAARKRRISIIAGVTVGVIVVASALGYLAVRGTSTPTNAMSRYVPGAPASGSVCDRSHHGVQEELDVGVTGPVALDEVYGLFNPFSPPGVIAPKMSQWHYVDAAANCWSDDADGTVQVAVAQFATTADANMFVQDVGHDYAPNRTSQSVPIAAVPDAFTMTSASGGLLGGPPTWSLGSKGRAVFVVITIPSGDSLDTDATGEAKNRALPAALMAKIYRSLP